MAEERPTGIFNAIHVNLSTEELEKIVTEVNKL